MNTTRRFVLAVSLMACATVLIPGPAAAQESDPKLSTILLDEYTRLLTSEYVALNIVFPGANRIIDLAGFVRSPVAIALGVNQLVGTQAAAFPLGSSAGGFTWTFDPGLGTFQRESSSFGPTFAERALTVGKGRANIGVNFQRATFDSLEGLDLEGGEVKTYAGFNVTGANVYFENALRMKLSTNTIGLFGTYGVTNRLDVGIAVPIVTAHLDVGIDYRAVVNGSSSAWTTGKITSGSASGIGDVVARAKYNFLKTPGGGIAAGVDIRLPTGDEENFLGVAGAQSKMYVALSVARGRVSPHVNFGYTVSGASDAATSDDTYLIEPPDEVNFAGGVDYAITPRLTVAGDVVGRRLKDSLVLKLEDSIFGRGVQQFSVNQGDLNVLLGSAGVKYNPNFSVLGNGLIAFNVLFPLNDKGLTDQLTWMGGVEFSF